MSLIALKSSEKFATNTESNVERRRVARAYGDAIIMLCPLMLLYWATPVATNLSSLYGLVNGTAPIYFAFILSMLAIRTLKRMPDSIWAGVFWFPIQAAIFYGFGPLVEVFGNAITLRGLAIHKLAVTETDLFRAHKLSTTGIFFIFVGMFLHLNFWRQAWTKKSDAMTSSFPLKKLGVLMVLLGAAFKYLILLPAQWGELNIKVAGVISGLGNVLDLGFAIVAFCAASGNKQQRLFLFLTLPIHIFLSVLAFSKLITVTSILLPIIGAYAAHRRKKRLLINCAALALIYASTQPLVHFGRGVIYERTFTISEAGYIDRAGIVYDFLFSTRAAPEATEEDRQGWWTRLSSAGPQAYAMELYDQGNHNRTLDQAWMFFIPRAVWPEKPIMVGPGLEFYRLVTGREQGQSFLALSIYGDLYWQYGWNGVIFGSTLIGFLFSTLSSQSVRAIRRRDFLLLPAVLMALEMTLLGPNAYLLNGIIGPLPIYFTYYVVFPWIFKIFFGVRKA
jgi:hypothetical protein